ncbi:MAG: hypothetical protein J5637_08915 [Prevotella sp.]|nr:hypothetical protein [Prevotella sp.]
MKYPIHQILHDVSVRLDLDDDDQPLIAVNDRGARTIADIIASQVEWGARQVIEEAPSEKLAPGVPLHGGVAWQQAPGVGMALLLLPDDFLRLLAIRMSDWQRDAKVITALDEEYQWQSSRFPAIRGNPERPVAAIVTTPMGQAVELYSSQGGAGVTIAKALYQPVPHIVQGTIELPPLLYHNIIDRIATLTRQSYVAFCQ